MPFTDMSHNYMDHVTGHGLGHTCMCVVVTMARLLLSCNFGGRPTALPDVDIQDTMTRVVVEVNCFVPSPRHASNDVMLSMYRVVPASQGRLGNANYRLAMTATLPCP